jgi:hypothetical protein
MTLGLLAGPPRVKERRIPPCTLGWAPHRGGRARPGRTLCLSETLRQCGGAARVRKRYGAGGRVINRGVDRWRAPTPYLSCHPMEHHARRLARSWVSSSSSAAAPRRFSSSSKSRTEGKQESKREGNGRGYIVRPGGSIDYDDSNNSNNGAAAAVAATVQRASERGRNKEGPAASTAEGRRQIKALRAVGTCVSVPPIGTRGVRSAAF